jgi:hypothetical protein
MKKAADSLNLQDEQGISSQGVDLNSPLWTAAEWGQE